MIAVVFLLPPLLLCAVLALGRYEERMLPSSRARHRGRPH